MIYVQAFVGLPVLTVSVLSNGNNYGAFHPLFTGLLWGGGRHGDGGALPGGGNGGGQALFLNLDTEPKE